jgi:spore coat polysaccharide biosynthesis predicted glycosyltransferase SpsG
MTDNAGRGIFFRADGSKKLGLGHISRCLNLASAVKENLSEKKIDIPINFVLRDFEGARNYIKGTEYEKSARWILATENDIAAFGKILDEQKPYIVITDINLQGRVDKYLEAIHPATHFSLHEFNFSLLHGDRVIAPTIHPLDPAPGATLGVTHFIGPDYVLISPDIIKLRGSLPELNDPPKSVLVTMGGGDPENLTEKILNAIRAINVPYIDWKVVLGPASGYDKLKFVREYPTHINYFEGMEIRRAGFIEQLKSSDAVITNGGTTVYEALALGKPVLAIPQNDFEKQVIDQLVEMEACLTPSENTSPKILEVLSKFLDESFSRLTLSENGMKIFDGQGVYRVAEMIVELLETRN